MFSSTMIASSITMPTASVNASRVILLSEKSMYRISVNVAIMEVGMARAAINTARQLRITSSTTKLARKLPRTRCSSSECTEALMKTEMSWTTSRWTPGGQLQLQSLEPALDVIGHAHGIRARLPEHRYADCIPRHMVLAEEHGPRAQLLGAVFHPADLPHAHRHPAARGNDDVGELDGGIHPAERPQPQVLRAANERSEERV